MAKQTFTVGQVLTAAQLTSLQQTAMGGGAASAKTASYTLVAADAGTTISMTSTSATTITVNTGLFAAGDTVFIQNLGSGNCTVTAGTATVSTAGSTILPTNDAGILYFVSTGVAIFYDFIQTGAVSPLTTKGDLYGFSTLDSRIPIGANNTVLTADSNETLGLKWAAPAGGSGLTLIQRTSFSAVANTGTTFDNIFTSTYKAYQVVIEDIGASTGTDDGIFEWLYSGSVQSLLYFSAAGGGAYNSATFSNIQTNNTTKYTWETDIGDATNGSSGVFYFYKVGNTSERPRFTATTYSNFSGIARITGGNLGGDARTYTGIRLSSSSSNISGTVAVYGLATA